MSQFIIETGYARLPGEVTTATRRTLLDTLGVALAGRDEPAAEIVCRLAAASGARQSSTIIGTAMRTTPSDAAWANGVLAHVLDYDDVGHRAQGHVSALLFPVVLALAEELGSSGEEVVTAYALGVEVWARIAATMPMLHNKGWHPTSVFGTIGASAAAAKLLHLDAAATANAMAIAASSAAGLVQNFGTFTKSLHVGNAARNGVVAALLAREGFNGSPEILAAKGGFPQAFFHGQPVDDTAMAVKLGEPFAIVSPGVYVKRYPCCGILQRILDAAIHLAKTHHLNPDEIEDVECELPPLAARILFYTEPVDSLQAKFSLQHTVAAALIDRRVGLSQLTDERVQGADVRKLGRRIRLVVHKDGGNGDDTPDVAVIRLKDGRRLVHSVLHAKGNAEAPLDWDELVDKFRDTAGRVLDERGIARAVDLVSRIERQKSVGPLMQAVAQPTTAATRSAKPPLPDTARPISFNPTMLDLGSAGGGEARLVGSQCPACGKVYFPRQTRCSECTSEAPLSERALSTQGRLYAFTTVERETLVPKGFPVPYAYGYVDLPEGIRLVARLTDCAPGDLRLDLPVEMVVRPIRQDASGADVMGFCFRPVAAGEPVASGEPVAADARA